MVTMINTALLRALTTLSGARARLRDERGQDLLEYALLGGLIAAAITAATVAVLLTGALETMATNIGECIDFDGVCP